MNEQEKSEPSSLGNEIKGELNREVGDILGGIGLWLFI